MRWGVTLVGVVAIAAWWPALASSARPDAEARAWALRAYRAEQLGDVDEAERSWRWAVRRDEDARVHQAEALARMGRRQAAARAYHQAVDGPDGVRARAGLARLGFGDPASLVVLDEEAPCWAWWSAPTSERARRCRAH